METKFRRTSVDGICRVVECLRGVVVIVVRIPEIVPGVTLKYRSTTGVGGEKLRLRYPLVMLLGK